MKHLQLKLALMAILLSFALMPASAYNFEVDGIYYNLLSYSDLTVEVTSGDNKYAGDIKIPEQVTISNQVFTVTTIADGAFDGCTDITSLTIGNSVTTIGRSAFRGCSGLTNLVIPNSVTTIDNYAFRGCSGLTNLVIPNSVTTIGGSAFYGCI